MISEIRSKLVDIDHQLKKSPLQDGDFEKIKAALLRCLEEIKELNLLTFNCSIPNALKSISSRVNPHRIRDEKKRKTLDETIQRLTKCIAFRNCAVPTDPRCQLNGAQKHNYRQFFNIFLRHDFIEIKTDDNSGFPIDPALGDEILTLFEEFGNYHANELLQKGLLLTTERKPIPLNLLALETLSNIHKLALVMDTRFSFALAAPKNLLAGFISVIREPLTNYGNDNHFPYRIIMEIADTILRVAKTGKYSQLMFMIREQFASKMITLDQCLDMKMIVRDCLLNELEKMVKDQAAKAEILKNCEKPLPETPVFNFVEETLDVSLGGDRNAMRTFLVPGHYPKIKKELIDATILRDCDTPRRVRLGRLRMNDEDYAQVLQSTPLLLPPARNSIEIDDRFFSKPNGFYLLPLHTHQPESVLQEDKKDRDGFTCNIQALNELGWNRPFYEFPTLSLLLHVNPNILSLCEPAVQPPMGRPTPILMRDVRREVGFSEQLVEEGSSGIQGSIQEHIFELDTPPVNLILYASSVWRHTFEDRKDLYDYQDLKYMLCAYFSCFHMIKNLQNDEAAPTVYTDKETVGVYNNSFHMGYALQLLAARLTGINLTMVLRESDEILYREHCSTIENVINTMMNGGYDVDNILNQLVKYQEIPLNTLELLDCHDWRPRLIWN